MVYQQVEQQLPISRITLASRRIQSLTKLSGGLRMDGIDLYTLVFQKHPDNSAMLLLYRHAYSAAIRSAHQLTDPKVQCFWCLLQPPSLALSRVGPLQSPDVLLVPPIESHPSCIGLVSIVILFRLHIVLLRDRSAR